MPEIEQQGVKEREILKTFDGTNAMHWDVQRNANHFKEALDTSQVNDGHAEISCHVDVQYFAAYLTIDESPGQHYKKDYVDWTG